MRTHSKICGKGFFWDFYGFVIHLYIKMKTFVLNRKIDVTGISSKGIVCEGCILSNGKVILNWLGETSSIVIHDNIENVIKIHCHNGQTEIIYD